MMFLGLVSLVLTGCPKGYSGSGYLNIREHRYFEVSNDWSTYGPPRGSVRAEMELKKCEFRGRSAPGPYPTDLERQTYERYRRQEEPRLRRECASGFDYMIKMPSHYTVFGRLNDVRCEPLRGAGEETYRCEGRALTRDHWGKIEIHAITQGSRILSAEIWQVAPGSINYADPTFEYESIASHGYYIEPRLIAAFEHRD